MELVAVLSGHRERVWDVSWSPHGTLLASCGADKAVRLWAASPSASSSSSPSWVCSAVVDGLHQRTVRRVCWSPCGNLISTASFDATVSVLDRRETGSFECVATLEGHENEVKAAPFSASGQLLATCGRDKTVWVWEMEDGGDNDFECLSVLNSHTQDVKAVVWHPLVDELVSASYDNTIKVYREDSDGEWSCVDTLEGHESTVWSVCFDATGDRLVSCSADRTVKIWQRYKPNNPLGVATDGVHDKFKCVCTLNGVHTRDVFDVSWSRHANRIVTACGDNALRVFQEQDGSDPNAPSFALVSELHDAHDQDINAVEWSPSEPDVFATASDDRTVKIWRVKLD